MRLWTLLAVLLFLASSWGRADPIDDFIKAEMQRSQTHGLSLAIVRDGKIVREQAYGLANLEHQVPVKPATLFQAASIGKQFTAALVMLLVEDGKLGLDDPVARHLPNTPPAWKDVTVRHLLTHTSGLADPGDKIDLRKDYTDDEMIAIAGALPLDFQPGEDWAYSNVGYQLLGYLCTKVGGKFYGDQLRERIFAPLGMSARVISERDIVPHRAAGYELVDGQVKNQEWVSPTMNATADGSLYVTAHDLALWDLALYGDKPLSARIRQASWTPVTLKNGSTQPYGFGWSLEPVNGHRRVWHNGRWQGFRSVIHRFVDDRLAVIVLANSTSAPVEKIGNQVARMVLPALVQHPIADTEPAATARAKEILAYFERGEQPPGLSASAREFFSPQFMGWVRADMRDFGKLSEVQPMERGEKNGKRLYVYRARFAHDDVTMKFSLNKAGEIENVELLPE